MRGMIVSLVLMAVPALGQDPFAAAKQLAGNAATKQVETEVNKRLLAEARKNQCSFKTDSDQLAPGCDKKLKNLANALIDANKRLNSAGISNYKFEVSGHTDTTGDAAYNLKLGEERAMAVRDYIAKKHSIALSRLNVISYGEEKPVVDNKTREDRAQNRRVVIRILE